MKIVVTNSKIESSSGNQVSKNSQKIDDSSSNEKSGTNANRSDQNSDKREGPLSTYITKGNNKWKPMDGFVLFSQHKRRRIEKERPELDHGSICQLVIEQWNKLSGSEKEVYFQASKEVIYIFLSDLSGFLIYAFHFEKNIFNHCEFFFL